MAGPVSSNGVVGVGDTSSSGRSSKSKVGDKVSLARWSIIIKQLLLVKLNFFNVPFIGSLQIYKAGDPTRFKLGDNSAGFFKTTNVGVRGLMDSQAEHVEVHIEAAGSDGQSSKPRVCPQHHLLAE